MGKLTFNKFANFNRKKEPVNVSIPFEKGALRSIACLKITDDKKETIKSQVRALGLWDDGSIKWAKVDFLADLPANKGVIYDYAITNEPKIVDPQAATIYMDGDTLVADNFCMSLAFNNKAGEKPFRSFSREHFKLEEHQIDGPYLLDETGARHAAILSEPWTVEEDGPIFVKLSAKGKHGDSGFMDFIISVIIYTNTPWFEIQYRIINRLEPEYTHIKKIALDLHFNESQCETRALATSNYLSNIRTETGEQDLQFMIDADYLLYDANEHIPEVFYGTFFADWNSKKGGICATHYQAYQNFPKALKVSKKTLSIDILPEEYGRLKYYRGMAKRHSIFLHLHRGDEPIEAINKRSLMLQQMDKPILPAYVYEQSGCFPNFFAKNKNVTFESSLINMADNRGKAFGILHWGDCPDSGYSQQGRGGGANVWTNNEYDFPYAAIKLYARSGVRRMLDYALVAGAHLADIDVCHYDPDPLRHGAQIEHSKDHVTGNVEISHEWVEGLLAYYHQTGDSFAYDAAIGIGQNIMRHLDEPKYHKKGEINARETGWALRALIALYRETNDAHWLTHADFIVSHFTDWKEIYGGWFAPYTDHTVVRVPFMISVAVASLIRYYRVKPREDVKAMIIDAMEDLIDNAILENGLFYYKDLPSLDKAGRNPIVLEALACAYELTGDEKYLRAGIPTFMKYVNQPDAGRGKKEKIEDGILMTGNGPKRFAQAFYPLTYYYYHVSNAGILG